MTSCRDIESEIRLFADECVCYRKIKDMEDTLKLQKDIDRLVIWVRKWGMRFQPVNCNTDDDAADKKAYQNPGFVYPRGFGS